MNFPGSTQTTVGRGNVRYFRKPRYITKKKRTSAQVQMTKRLGLGGAFRTRVTSTLSILGTAAGTSRSTSGVVAGVLAATDFSRYAALYSYYSVTKIVCSIFLGPATNEPSTTMGVIPLFGFGYDSSADTATITSVNALTALNHFTILAGDKVNQQYSNNPKGVRFSFQPISKIAPPLLCSSTDENYGNLKTVSSADWVDATGLKYVAQIVINYYVIFSGNI